METLTELLLAAGPDVRVRASMSSREIGVQVRPTCDLGGS